MGDLDIYNNTLSFYTGFDRFDYDKSNTEWKFVGFTLNDWKYSEDARLRIPGTTSVLNGNIPPQNIWIRRLNNNKLYIFQNWMTYNQ